MSHSANGHALSHQYPDLPPITCVNVPLSTAELKKRLVEKLRASGLTTKDGERLGYKLFPASEFPKELPRKAAAAGFQLPYTDISGEYIADFFRYRYLEEPPHPTVAVRRKLPNRYIQPFSLSPRACFPRTYDWKSWQKEVKADGPVDLFITEGELKAACACKRGFPTIALGGVWNFRSKTVALIEDLAQLDWPKIRVYIVYDSDAKDNHLVVMAENALGRELEKRGAVVRVVRLPALDANKKTGLDDYLVAQAPKAADDFRALLLDPEATQAPGLYDIRDAYFERPMAENFASEHRDIVRHTDAGTWMAFVEGRWTSNDIAIKQLLGEFLKQQMPAYPIGEGKAEDDAEPKNDEERKAVAERKKAKKTIQLLRKQLSSAHYASSVLELTASQPGIQMRLSEFDADPNLLGLPDGSLCDLSTGEVRSATAEDYVSRSTTVMPEGDCPRWLQFLREITAGDTALISYLQRLAGYCLTGFVNEEVWPNFYGPGGNGKGTFWETLSKTLGNTYEGGYAAELPPETLMAQRYSNDYSTQNDIARLRGARLALTDEGDKHRELNADLVKKLTGGGMLVGKFMHKDKFEFAPTHKLVTLCNYKPRIEVDDATKRRLHLIPLLQKFKSGVTEQNRTADEYPADDKLKEKLLAEAPGILLWAIKGNLKWRSKGLQAPATVTQFTGDFFNAADPYENWITACGHEKDRKEFQSSKDLYSNWSRYCDGIRQHPGDFKAFVEDLEKRTETFTKGRPKKGGKQERGFYGLKLTKPPTGTALVTDEQKKQMNHRREEVVAPIAIAAGANGKF